MGLLEILGGLIIAGVAIAILFVLAKKDNEEGTKLISDLTEEQINILKSADVIPSSNNEFVCTAMVAKIVEKGSKVSIRLLYVNKITLGGDYNKITFADSKIKKEEQEKYNLKTGDFVKININFDKFTVKVILD